MASPSSAAGPAPALSAPSHTRITPALLASAAETSRDGGDTLDFSRSNLTEVGEDGLEGLASGTNGRGVRRLALSHNSLTILPSSFIILTRLRYLNLKGNDFREIPAVLGQLQSLEILDISRNKIRKMPDRPGRLAYLRVLSLSQNRIKTLPTYMAEFKDLKVFKIDQNPLEWPPREVMARPKVSDNDDANEKAWIAHLREWLRSQDDLVGRDTAAAQSSSPATAVPIGVSRSADSISPSTRPGHVRQLSQGSRQLPNATGHQPQVRPGHQRNPSSQGSTGPALSADSTMSPGPGHHRSFSQQSSVGHSPSELSASLSSSTGPPSGHQRKTSLGGSGSGGHLRTHSRSLSQTVSSTSVSFRSAPLIEDAQEDGERPSYEPIDLPPFVQSAGEGFYPSPSPSPVEVRLKTHPIPSPVGPSGGPSSALEPVPARRLQGSHSRNASANIQPQRLSQILSSKKSLPDLRQPHAQIIGERQASGLGRSRIAGAPNVMRGVPSAGEMIDAEAALRQASSRAVSRKMSDDTLRRPITGSTPSLSATSSHQPFYASCAPQESAILEVNPREGSRDSYFRRLSTLQGSTIPKSVPPSILALVDSARGLLFALSQVEQAIRQHSAAAIDNGYTGVLASVLGHAGEYTDRMIDSLDRFDSVSRRASMPPPAIIIGVIEASRDGVQKFGKVVDVFAAHTKMSAPKTAAVNDQSFADVRFARTLVLLLFGAIGEVAFAWKAMAPIIEAVAPLLRETAAASSTSSISSSQAQSWTPPPPPLPLSRQHHIMSSSTSSRTPISPIPERAESHSPASSSARLDGSPIVSRIGAPLPSSLLISSVASPPQSGPGSGFSTPAPTPGPPSQAARSKSRRHAGSFSTKDVQIGSHIPPMPSPQPNGHHREDSAVLETPVIPIGKSCSSPPGGRSTPLRSALRDPFMASPSTLQTTTSSPAPAVSTSDDILPFSASDPFPVPAGSSADSQQQQQPFLSPRPHQTQLPPPGGSSGPSILGHTPGESSSTTPETTSFVRYHPPAGGHSAQSSISSSVGTPVSPSMSRERSYFDGGGGPSSSLLDVVGSSGGGGAGGSSRVMDEELLDNIENGVEIALSVWVLLEQDLGWASKLSFDEGGAPPTSKRIPDLISTLQQADALTRRLHQTLHSAASRRQETLFDEALKFFMSVRQIATLVRTICLPPHKAEAELRKSTKSGLARLTKLAIESASLLHVYVDGRPGTSMSLFPLPTAASSSISHHQHQPSPPEEVLGNLEGTTVRREMRPFNLGRGKTGGGGGSIASVSAQSTPRGGAGGDGGGGFGGMRNGFEFGGDAGRRANELNGGGERDDY